MPDQGPTMEGSPERVALRIFEVVVIASEAKQSRSGRHKGSLTGIAASALRPPRNDREELLLEDQLAVLLFPAKLREKRHAEQVLSQRFIRQHERRDVAYRDAADVDLLE